MKTMLDTRCVVIRILSQLRFSVISLLLMWALCADGVAADILRSLTQEAFKHSQMPWKPQTPTPLTEFDSPENDGSLGLDFVEYTKMNSAPFYDDGTWWVRANPRGNSEKDPLDLRLSQPETGSQAPVVYHIDDFNYRHPGIQPPLPQAIPAAARYLSAIDIGFHQRDVKRWPQILHLGGNGYGRLTGFPPLGFGTSFRFGVHKAGEPDEDFVKLRKLYLMKLNDQAFRLLGLVECEAFAAAFTATLQPGETSSLRVAMKIFLRFPLRLANKPSVGPLGLSSMFWKDESATPNVPTDEAHDADRFVSWSAEGVERWQTLAIPNNPIAPPLETNFGPVTDFALIQSDRNAGHYRRYDAVEYANRASLLVSDIESSLPYTVGLWQSYTTYEGADNIAVFVRFDQDAPLPASIKDGITFSYTLTAYR
ncbi:MAG: glucan biosynthesis protein [Phycisphaerales bacterium]|nr:glucan biosynthesis protein [Phycisphaerales bacterium]